MKKRIEAIFGSTGCQRLASALQCTPQRFNYKPAPARLCAVLELLELAKKRGISEAEWPVRFWSSSTTSTFPENDLKERFAELFGDKALAPRLAVVLSMSQVAIADAFNDRSLRARADLVAIIELLEMLQCPLSGVKSWPERWWQINSEVEFQRSTRRLPGSAIDPLLTRDRIERVLEGSNASARFARALEKTPDALSRTWRSEVDSHGRSAKVQSSTLAIVELLETLRREGIPVERWPERWRVAVRRHGRPRASEPPLATFPMEP